MDADDTDVDAMLALDADGDADWDASATAAAAADGILSALVPLPPEVFPRALPVAERTRGFYVALGLVMSVSMITPLSCAYVVWYAVYGRLVPGLTAPILAAYAVTETVFAVYYHYLARYVQAPAPVSTLPLEVRAELFQRVLRAGLARPLPSALPASADARLLAAEDAYSVGRITAAQYAAALDGDVDAAGAGRREVGKLGAADRAVLDAFVEASPGARARRLKAEVEGAPPGPGTDTGLDAAGAPRPLHPADPRAVEFRERLRTWFDHAPWASIRRGNVRAWLAWSCFGAPLAAVESDPERAAFLARSLDTLEARTGTSFEGGYDESVKVLRLTIDPVNATGRPLGLYAVTNAVNWVLRDVVYPAWGMGLYREGDIDYLIRIPKGWTPEMGQSRPNAMPVVYLHGLGFGLLQNHLLIKHLLKSLPTHPLIVPIAYHTSQAFFNERHLRPWTRRETVDALKAICRRWGFWDEVADGPAQGGVSLLSHSNGSVAHGWVLKDCPSLVRRSTFVDPVVFCLWEGDVCHSFCYRTPTTTLELLLYYFIASEVGIANYIQRHFDWADNTLFFEEIPNATDPSKTAFFLGGKDLIIDAPRTRRYLERHGVGACVHWDGDAGHGDGLAGASRDRVVMYVGTGSTDGWEGWIRRGRQRHSRGFDAVPTGWRLGWTSGDATEDEVGDGGWEGEEGADDGEAGRVQDSDDCD